MVADWPMRIIAIIAMALLIALAVAWGDNTRRIERLEALAAEQAKVNVAQHEYAKALLDILVAMEDEP